MKKFSELLEEFKKNEIVCYATIKPGHDDIQSLDESFTNKWTVSAKNGLPKNFQLGPYDMDKRALFGDDEIGERKKAMNSVSARHHNLNDIDITSMIHPLVEYTGNYSKVINKILVHHEKFPSEEEFLKHKRKTNLKNTESEEADRYNKYDHLTHLRHVTEIDRVLNDKQNALGNDLVVYSGLGEKFGKKLLENKVNSTVHFPAYTSTSLDHSICDTFASRIPGKKYFGQNMDVKNIAVFHLPKGYHQGRYIDHHSDNPGESEVVLARGQKFKYFDRRIDKHNIRVRNKTPDIFVYHHFKPINTTKPK